MNSAQARQDQHTIKCLRQVFSSIDTNEIPLIDRVASFSVGQHLHFGHTTTSRAECVRWSEIKLHLRRSCGTLLDVYDRIDKSTKRRLSLLFDRVDRERVEVLTLPMETFAPVLRCIALFALKKTHEEYKKAFHLIDLPACSGRTQTA